MGNKSVLFRVILMAGSFLLAGQAFSQRMFEASLGAGVPEYLCLKIKYGNNIQVGASVHFWHYSEGGIFDEYNSWSLAGEVQYRFGGTTEFNEQRPWYLLAGLGYYHIDYLIDSPHEEYSSGFYPRIGRTVNFSERVGTNFDFGLFLPFSAAEGYEPYKFKILLSGSICLFFRL
jgi:hypothetical protein